jgi:hypothetical protein
MKDIFREFVALSALAGFTLMVSAWLVILGG